MKSLFMSKFDFNPNKADATYIFGPFFVYKSCKILKAYKIVSI